MRRLGQDWSSGIDIEAQADVVRSLMPVKAVLCFAIYIGTITMPSVVAYEPRLQVRELQYHDLRAR